MIPERVTLHVCPVCGWAEAHTPAVDCYGSMRAPHAEAEVVLVEYVRAPFRVADADRAEAAAAFEAL